MRFAFRGWPWDLCVAVTAAAALFPVLAFGVGGLLGLGAAVLALLFLPGYVLVVALFPAAGELDVVRRVTLSIVVSLAAIPPAGLLANATPWGIRPEAIFSILAGVTLAGSVAGYVRRMRLPEDRRLGLSIDVTLPRWASFSRTERVLAVVFAACVATAAGSLALSGGPAPPPGFTEFGLLNEFGVPGDYPTDLAAGEEGRLVLLVVSHETSATGYEIQVRLATLVWTFNETSGRNESTEVSASVLETLSLTLGAGEERRLPYAFTIPDPGDYAVRFRLFKGAVGPGPYQEVSLLVRVS